MRRRTWMLVSLIAVWGLCLTACTGDKTPNGPAFWVSTELVVVTFRHRMSDAQVDSFANAHSLLVAKDFESASRVVFLFELDRSVIPREVTASAYAARLAASDPELIEVASAEAVAGHV